jgi:hypothetical protein
MLRHGIVVILVAVPLVACVPHAMAQNDWQFPDPYFGILEFEKDHVSRPRAQGSTAQPQPPASPSRGQRPRLFRPRPRAAARTYRP